MGDEGKLKSRAAVHSLLSVISSNPVEPGKVHKLTTVDRAMGAHTLHLVFYYKTNPFNEGPWASDLDNLRVSLSLALDEYTVVLGRLARGPDDGCWIVKCNDAGVRMVLANVGATLDEWLGSADVAEERDLTVWEEMPEDPTFWSPFRIQISNFKCGALAIGLSCTHMQADITSAISFINSWAQVHRGLPLSHPPIFDRPPPPASATPTPFTNATKNDDIDDTPPKMGSATLKFSGSTIQKHLSQVQSHCPNATPFNVLVALLWPQIAQHQEPTRIRSISLCVDSRNHGSPPVPKTYFGNALHFSVLFVDSDKLASDGVVRLSECVHTHIAGLKRDELWLEEDEGGRRPFRVYGTPWLTCINMENMVDCENGLMYDAAFNGERPVHVSCNVGNVGGEGFVKVMPSPEGRLGRTVKVVLPERQIDELCKDQTVLDLEPTMLI